MKVGFVGFGKLGAPVGLAIESKGHRVLAYDVDPRVEEYFENKSYPHQEEGLQELLDTSNIKFGDIEEVVLDSDIVFVPIQTPHEPLYEGVDRIPEDRKDFDYTFLKKALSSIAEVCEKHSARRTVAVISTCLPGTYNEQLSNYTNELIDYVYTPQFIAMGTVIDDYLNPEFNLIGVESEEAADQLVRFYATINDAPNIRTDITTAEGIKVSYNTWITAKTVIANAWGELSEKLDMNFSDIKKAWDISNKRLISTKYMDAGMSDGGGCHPRDNIAMSYLADKVAMSHNIWEDLMMAREMYEQWHADYAVQLAVENELPLILLGRSFKPETSIEVGSPALLMGNLIRETGIPYQHYEDVDGVPPVACYFIATRHARYNDIKFQKGSIIADPFGFIQLQDGVTIIPIGRKNGRKPDSKQSKTKHSTST